MLFNTLCLIIMTKYCYFAFKVRRNAKFILLSVIDYFSFVFFFVKGMIE